MPIERNFFGKSTLLMNTSYIVFPWGDLNVYGIIIASGINSHNSVIRLNELITQVPSYKTTGAQIITISCKNTVFSFYFS